MTAGEILTPVVLGLALVGYVWCLRRMLWAAVAASLGLGGLLWWVSPPTAESYLSWGLGGTFVVTALLIRALLPAPPVKLEPQYDGVSGEFDKGVVIDGTNVMFWDGEADMRTLRLVVDQLRTKGLMPFVFLDASSRHHLGDPSLDEKGFARALGLKRSQIMVCPARTEADSFILKFAREQRLPIVSNDRFGDRAAQVKGLRLIKGGIAAGRPILQGI